MSSDKRACMEEYFFTGLGYIITTDNKAYSIFFTFTDPSFVRELKCRGLRDSEISKLISKYSILHTDHFILCLHMNIQIMELSL